jgi:TRAP transporter 4TM/12TM fusion protein
MALSTAKQEPPRRSPAMATDRSNILPKIIHITASVVAIGAVCYHLLYSQMILQEVMPHLNTHLFLALILLFLNLLLKSVNQKSRMWPLWLVPIFLSIVSTAYIALSWQDLDYFAGLPHTTFQIAIGVTLIALCLTGAWFSFGPVMPVICIVFTLYSYLGHFIPGSPGTSQIGFDSLISKLSIDMDGIYGMILNVSATQVYLFIIFAVLVQTTGAVTFFHEIGKFVGRRLPSGAAATAVITSGLVGSITGFAAANVTVTGSFTIPAMKKAGYRPEQAAGIEAAASSGGPIIPPVMGLAAFIMSGITGIGYFKIATVAILPAFLYIVCCLIYVLLQGKAMQVAPLREAINTKQFLLSSPLFMIPLLIIIFLFVKNFSALYVSFWACISIILLTLPLRGPRSMISAIFHGFIRGALLASQIAIMCAIIGLIVKAINIAGLGLLLPHIVSNLVGDNVVMLLIFTAVVAIILGMGLPAATSYIMVAVILAPMMLKYNLGLLPSHFFCLYLCNFSFITPPVALAAIFASKLAGSGYIKTSLEAFKVGVGGFILPFLFIWNPALLLDFSEPIGTILYKCIGTVLILFALQISFTGYYLAAISFISRLLILLPCALFILSIYFASVELFAMGLAVFILLTLFQYRWRRYDVC